jgi:hypothetical protein
MQNTLFDKHLQWYFYSQNSLLVLYMYIIRNYLHVIPRGPRDDVGDERLLSYIKYGDETLMKQFLRSTLAITFPWVIILSDDNPGGAFLALILQATIIGWIPASMWAWKIVHPEKKPRKKQNEKEKAS